MNRLSMAILALVSLGSLVTTPPALAEGNGDEQSMESVTKGTARHQTTLGGVTETAPEEAQSGLENAIENSSKGQSSAVEGLERKRFEAEEDWHAWDRERMGRATDRPRHGPRRR